LVSAGRNSVGSPEERAAIAHAMAPKRKQEQQSGDHKKQKQPIDWTELEREISLLVSGECKISSPFVPDDIKDDVQVSKHGTCHVLASIILAHAHQAKGNLEPDPDHDAKWIEEKLESVSGKKIASGGVPRSAFNLLLGVPKTVELSDEDDVDNAIKRVCKMGGVLPYSPSEPMFKGAASEHVIVVMKEDYIAAWNIMKEPDTRWHAVMVIGVVSNTGGVPLWWLAKQTWSESKSYVLLPIVMWSQVAVHQSLLAMYIPHGPNMANGVCITPETLSLYDGQALPHAHAHLPDTDSRDATLVKKCLLSK